MNLKVTHFWLQVAPTVSTVSGGLPPSYEEANAGDDVLSFRSLNYLYGKSF